MHWELKIAFENWKLETPSQSRNTKKKKKTIEILKLSLNRNILITLGFCVNYENLIKRILKILMFTVAKRKKGTQKTQNVTKWHINKSKKGQKMKTLKTILLFRSFQDLWLSRDHKDSKITKKVTKNWKLSELDQNRCLSFFSYWFQKSYYLLYIS